MVSFVGAGFQSNVGLAVAGVLQGELDGTAVDTRGQAVSLITQPGDTTVQLA